MSASPRLAAAILSAASPSSGSSCAPTSDRRATSTLVTLIDMVRMQDELSEIIGRHVDLRTKGFLSRYFREEVVAEAEVEFVA
jgi:hypothetical protein